MSFSSFPRGWQQIAYSLLDDWGQFSTTLAVAPMLSEELQVQFRRELEIDGSYFHLIDLTPEMALNLSHWLHCTLPSLWGKNQDLVRMTMVMRCPADCHFVEEYATYSELARQFPFPFVFLLSPEEDWQAWQRQNTFLFDEQDSCLLFT